MEPGPECIVYVLMGVKNVRKLISSSLAVGLIKIQ
jgi:hypothetical protein